MPTIEKASVSKAQVIRHDSLMRSAKQNEADKKIAFEWIPNKSKTIDKLFTNTLIAAALLLCVTVARGAVDNPTVQSVFSAVEENVSLNLDESLGKLNFVSNLFPETALVFWSDTQTQPILAPIDGDIIHVWNAQEPYISMKGFINDVRSSADGEVMAIAHGNDEEIIVRIRHDDGLETLYGNLRHCYVEEGSAVYKGDIIGQAMADSEVVFEVRQDGRSIDPTYTMLSHSEVSP